MGKDDKMAEYLCWTCKHRNGELDFYHKIDSKGIGRDYTNGMYVNCREWKKHPGMKKAAPKCAEWMEPTSICPSYKKRGKK